MAAPKLNFGMKLLGNAEAERKLVLAKKEAEDTAPLYNKAIIILEMSHAKTFRQQGRPHWTALKHRKGKILQKSNDLMRSVTARTTDSIREVKAKSLTFGTRLPYGPTHQFGYDPRNIPQRRFLGVYPEDIKKMEKEFSTDLENRIKVVASSG